MSHEKTHYQGRAKYACAGAVAEDQKRTSWKEDRRRRSGPETHMLRNTVHYQSRSGQVGVVTSLFSSPAFRWWRSGVRMSKFRIPCARSALLSLSSVGAAIFLGPRVHRWSALLHGASGKWPRDAARAQKRSRRPFSQSRDANSALGKWPPRSLLRSRGHFPEAPCSRALHLRTRGPRKMAAPTDERDNSADRAVSSRARREFGTWTCAHHYATNGKLGKKRAMSPRPPDQTSLIDRRKRRLCIDNQLSDTIFRWFVNQMFEHKTRKRKEIQQLFCGREYYPTSSRLISSLEKVRPGISPRFFSQKIAANDPEKNMPSTAANATIRSP
ncbi:unnamed protein product [Ranitomeya imitator]|uniref:Uncharacterized protein n=1 Tax=Ranitomeya imitator TaxID=111125 RepID=A0ABN9MLZ8_9NEOB|nr:unnamed protein product [Ranitomeya imitator]